MEDICSENDEAVLVKNLDRIEELIIEGIFSIRKNVSSPYATILLYINNGDEFNLNIASLKRIMKDMLDKGINYMLKVKKGNLIVLCFQRLG